LDNVAYIGLSQQQALQRKMDVVANNLANQDTTGFKVEQLLVNTQPGAPATNAGVKGPAQFVIDGGIGRDFSEGELSTTGRPLDLAIDGNAFFKVSTPQGERYTKDGRFAIDAQDKLVTASGGAVLDDSGGEITLDSSNGEPQISADGVISQHSGQGPTTVRAGKIGVVRFDTLSVLSKEGNNLYSNTSNTTPQAAPDARIRQGMLEGSNVKPIIEITQLIDVQRAYERVTQMIQQTNDLSQQSIDRLAKVA
jgi:flagellar basal-body rod protein FlgF